METLRYVVLVNMLLVIVSVAYYALLRRETFFGLNRLMLWLSLAGSLLLPLLELPDWRPQPVRTVMQRTAQAIVPRVLPKLLPAQPEVTITFPNQQTYRAFQQPAFRWSWSLALVALYGFGVLGLLIRFGTQLLSLQRLTRQSRHEFYDDFTLVTNPVITSPFSFFDWVFVNPNQHTANEFEQILRHERVHVRERHSLDMLGTELLCVFFWFNPAAYLFRHLVRQTLEFSADQTVLAEGVDPKLYQYNLLKVSLAESHSAVTNHFSKSQLKSRIAMLNQPKSTKASWLKYPVFCVAILTVASSFAHPHPIHVVSGYMSQPIVETIAAVKKLAEQPIEVATTNIPEATDSLKAAEKIDRVRTSQPLRQLLASPPDSSVRTSIKSDSNRLSPTRYMYYNASRLYWIVTPKTTFDDFMTMKQEFARYGYTMQLNEIKYDPLYAYINRISLSVVRPSKSGANCDDLNDNTKPILSIAGYITVGSKSGEIGTGGLRYYKENFPETLRKTAADDESSVAQFVKEHRLDYLIKDGEQKFKDMGSGSSTFSKEYFVKNTSTRNSGLLVNPDGSLTIDEKLGTVKVFINNEPVNFQAVNMWKLNQLYSVVQKSQYNPARKESFVSALLIYTTED